MTLKKCWRFFFCLYTCHDRNQFQFILYKYLLSISHVFHHLGLQGKRQNSAMNALKSHASFYMEKKNSGCSFHVLKFMTWIMHACTYMWTGFSEPPHLWDWCTHGEMQCVKGIFFSLIRIDQTTRIHSSFCCCSLVMANVETHSK